jgi:Ca2+-binding EF-hand superfamily protein
VVVDLCLDSYQSRTDPSDNDKSDTSDDSNKPAKTSDLQLAATGGSARSLVPALRFFTHVLMRQSAVPGVAEAVAILHRGEDLARELDKVAAASMSRESAFVALMNSILGDVQRLGIGQSCIVPCGWRRAIGADAAEALETGGECHVLLVVHRRSEDTCDVSVCTSGAPAEFFHATRAAAPPAPAMQVARVRRVIGVPRARICQSAFWYLVLRPAVWAPDNDEQQQQQQQRDIDDDEPAPAAESFYEHMLPYLTGGLYRAVDDKNGPTHDAPPLESDFVDAARSADRSGALCVESALRCLLMNLDEASRTQLYTHDAEGRHARAATVLLALRFDVARMLEKDVQTVDAMSPTDDAVVRAILRELAVAVFVEEQRQSAATPLLADAQLEEVSNLVDRVSALATKARADVQQARLADADAKGDYDDEAVFLHWGRLRCDGFDPNALAGKPPRKRITRPVTLTSVNDRVLNVGDAVNALRSCVDVCNLLDAQRSQMRDTYAMRVALISSLFIEVLPVPRPLDETGKQVCFWLAQPMRYEQQALLLRMIHLVTRHYAAASMAVRVTRDYDARRLLTLGLIAAVGDRVARIVACDTPCHFSLHYAGAAEGPEKPFGFTLGQFGEESITMPFQSAAAQCARSLLLDYFDSVARAVPERNVIFAFELTRDLGEGERRLLDNICLHTGFDNEPRLLPRYFTGEDPLLFDYYPELFYLRDLVLLFKQLMVQTSDALPKVARWSANDAALTWLYKPPSTLAGGEGTLVVRGFGKELKPVAKGAGAAVARGAGKLLGATMRARVARALGVSAPRVPPSMADPSLLAGEPVDTEDDVLFLDKVPEMDSRLTGRDIELLLTFLTEPYLRIPLLLHFFADEGRMYALANDQLQAMVDACIFEPGQFLDAAHEALPTPPKAPFGYHDIETIDPNQYFSTACGLMLNEASQSPALLLAAVLHLLDLALDLDTGFLTLQSPAARVMLYTIRLCIRVEDYLVFVIRHAQHVKSGAPSHAQYKSRVRGIQPSDDVLAELVRAQRSLRSTLDDRVFGVLEGWRVRALKKHDVAAACVAHAHMAYLYNSMTFESEKGAGDAVVLVDERAVTTLLSAQVFLNINYVYTLDVNNAAELDTELADEDDADAEATASEPTAADDDDDNDGVQSDAQKKKAAKKKKKEARTNNPAPRVDMSEAELMLPQMQMFELFQRHRCALQRWLKAAPAEVRARVLYRVVQLVTSTNGAQSLSPDAPLQWSAQETAIAARPWVELPIPSYVGCWLPEAELADWRARLRLDKPPATYKEYLVRNTEAMGGTEINMQTGRFTTHSAAMLLLPEEAGTDPDFIEAMGAAAAGANRAQCVQIARTEARQWLQMVGRACDVHLWTEPDRRAPKHHYSRSLVSLALSEDTRWILTVLQPYLLQHDVLGNVGLQCEDRPRKNVAILGGRLTNVETKQSMLKEVVVYRDPPAVHVFDVESHGRRFERTLVFTSSPPYSLHCLPASMVVSEAEERLLHANGHDAATARRHSTLLVCAGRADSFVPPRSNVVVVRKRTAEIGPEQHLPSRHLYGLLPTALLEQYVMWQATSTGAIVGTLRAAAASPTELRVTLIPRSAADAKGFGMASADARVERVPVTTAGASAPAAGAAAPMLLLNGLTAPSGSLLSRLMRVLTRIETLSHILFWRPVDAAVGSAPTRIELPRLGVTFEQRELGRYYCDADATLFISDAATPRVAALVRGVPASVLMQDANGELYLLTSLAAMPIREAIGRSALPSEVQLSHGDQVHLDALADTSRIVLLPVHASESFVSVPSLTAALSLFLSRFAYREYARAARQVLTCVADAPMKRVERAFWRQLGTLSGDMHPEAHALRLRLAAVTSASRQFQPLPFQLSHELANYARCVRRIGPALRLSPEEELELFDEVYAPDAPPIAPHDTWILRSRVSFVARLVPGRADSVGAGPLDIKVALPRRALRTRFDFDAVDDRTVINSSGKLSLKNRSFLQHTRIKDDPPLQGAATVELLNKILHGNNLSLSGSTEKHGGFLFLYELMCNSIRMSLTDSDKSTYELGAALVRMLPRSETTGDSNFMSILRLMASDESLCSSGGLTSWAALLADRKEKWNEKEGFVGILPGAVKNSLSKTDAVSSFLEELRNIVVARDKEGKVRWPGGRSPKQRFPEQRLVVQPPPGGSLDAWRRQHALMAPRTVDFSRGSMMIAPVKVDVGGIAVEFGAADLDATFARPLSCLPLAEWVCDVRPADAGASGALPFDVAAHPSAKSSVGKRMIERLGNDAQLHAKMRATATELGLVGFDLAAIQAAVVPGAGDAALQRQLARLDQLVTMLEAQRKQDLVRASQLAAAALGLLNGSTNVRVVGGDAAVAPSLPPKRGAVSEQRKTLLQNVGRQSGGALSVWLELAVAWLLCGKGLDGELAQHAPGVAGSEVSWRAAASAIVGLALLCSRSVQTGRCLTLARAARGELSRRKADVHRRLVELASQLGAKRNYGERRADGAIEFDPRLLVFEFTSGFLLRRAQVELVRQFAAKFRAGESLCHQMIMGAGKTTVVSPLLSLMLGDTETLFMCVVPPSLLSFAHSVFRSSFASVVQKPVYTFAFERAAEATPQLVTRMQRARASNAVVVSTPTSIKSFMLKFIELETVVCDIMDSKKQELARSAAAPLLGSLMRIIKRAPAETRADAMKEGLYQQLQACRSILSMFRDGCCMLDEVDWILHPLKSELNWPLGTREPLDLTYPVGLRWQLPWHMCDAILQYQNGGKTAEDWSQSPLAIEVLRDLTAAIDDGLKARALLATPHIVVLSAPFYLKRLLPPLARWAFVFLADKGFRGLDERDVVQFLVLGTGKAEQMLKTQTQSFHFDDVQVKLLNLARDWLHSLLPHVLSKIDRVTYGLLANARIEASEKADQRAKVIAAARAANDTAALEAFDDEFIDVSAGGMPRTRKLLAVPFIGKDCPSPASEFSHPDVVIALSLLAYRYEGLRLRDFRELLKLLRTSMLQEYGPYVKRKTCRLYAAWVRLAGGTIRGWKEPSDEAAKLEQARQDVLDGIPLVPENVPPAKPAAGRPNDWFEELWPLHLIDPSETEQFERLYELLSRYPLVLRYYLDTHVFPVTMQFQAHKLSASGQELGGDALFRRRLGFSGTPSDLLPLEFGGCHYQAGDDGRMLAVLTSPDICAVHNVAPGWTVRSLLTYVANAGAPDDAQRYHALIDTGALITGMSNEQVARALLECGLPHVDGVVYMDSADNKLVLERRRDIGAGAAEADRYRTVPLALCGLAPERRFTFYDQVHTTGTDVKQHFTAKAAITVGKDTVFRDYAQGAFRMRGIETGQRLGLLVIPELLSTINTQVAIGHGNLLHDGPTPLPPGDVADRDRRREMLADVVGWLTINAMTSERVQASLLVKQNLLNVWRKRHFRLLCARAGAGPAADKDGETLRLVMLFREHVDNSVANVLEEAHSYRDALFALVARNGDRDSPDEHKIVQRILAALDDDPAPPAPPQGRPAVVRDANELEGERVQQQEQEQEQEQEQQQQQEQEMEMEQEQERVEVAPIKQPYERDDPKPVVWPLEQLGAAWASPPTEQTPGAALTHTPKTPFYSLSALCVKGGTAAGGNAQLAFPPYMLLSQNHLPAKWSTSKTPRRYRNVILVLEWVPDVTLLKEAEEARAAGTQQLDEEQRRQLKSAFDMFDADGSGALSRSEVRQVLRALDVENRNDAAVDAVFATADRDKSGTIDFEELCTAFGRRSFYAIEQGRYFVAMSLPEAACVRLLLHRSRLFGTPVVPGRPNAALALRIAGTAAGATGAVLGGCAALEATPSFPSGSFHQREMAMQCWRFFDSDTEYGERQLNMLLRSLQPNPCEQRATFFDAVRNRRRRRRVPWQQTPLARLFVTPNEYHLLRVRAAVSRLRAILRRRRMTLQDAFRRIDHDSDGFVTREELFGGLLWLGLRAQPADLNELMNSVDKNKDNIVSEDEFMTALGGPLEVDGEALTDSSNLPELDSAGPSAITIDNATAKDGGTIGKIDKRSVAQRLYDFLGRDLLAGVSISRVKVVNFDCAWTDKGIGLWRPTRAGKGSLLRAGTREILTFCFYAGEQFVTPYKAYKAKRGPKPYSLVLDDANKTLLAALVGSAASEAENIERLSQLVDLLLPHPRSMHLVVKFLQTRTPLYVWQPVPPSSRFVSFGMCVTTTPKPPEPEAMRCVPTSWVKPSTVVPQCKWKGEGGSLWIVNSLGSLAASSTFGPPPGPFYEIAQETYVLAKDAAFLWEQNEPSSDRNESTGASTAAATTTAAASSSAAATTSSGGPPPLAQKANARARGRAAVPSVLLSTDDHHAAVGAMDSTPALVPTRPASTPAPSLPPKASTGSLMDDHDVGVPTSLPSPVLAPMSVLQPTPAPAAAVLQPTPAPNAGAAGGPLSPRRALPQPVPRQPSTGPAVPTADKPAVPAAAKPAVPSTEKPAVPTAEKPAVPVAEKPAVPVAEKPAVPSAEKPAVPSAAKPAVPAVPSAPVPAAPTTTAAAAIPAVPSTPVPAAPSAGGGDRTLPPMSEIAKKPAPAVKKPTPAATTTPAPAAAADAPLPPNWERRVAPDGRVYYANHQTKKTSWTLPSN